MICTAKGQNNAQAKRGAKYNDHVQSCPVYRSTGSNMSQYIVINKNNYFSTIQNVQEISKHTA